jgi:hypothetical protein
MAQVRNFSATGKLILTAVTLAAIVNFSSGQAQMDKHDHGHGNHAVNKDSPNWTPVNAIHLYLCAFHISKENPNIQIESHHFCSQQGRKVHQCVIYNSRESDAKLLGVEYIVDDATYRSLPDEEKKYWHPHAYEIMAGQLVAPDLPTLGDDIFPGLIMAWGKTWHTWRDPASELPTGEPMLMWSANGDGQVADSLIAKRDAQFKISTADIRKRRASFGYPVPNIPAPKAMNEIGRQWTATGADKPGR